MQPAEEGLQPPWAETQAGTPDHVEKAWAQTHLGAPDAHVESASAPTTARPAEVLPPTPDGGSGEDARWPWYRRTAVVVPIAIVMIVAAVATILLVLSGGEEPAPNRQASPPGAGLDGTCSGAGSTELWESMSLQSQPDGSLEGDFVVRSPNPNCASNRPVTFTRTGDAEGGVSVTDPATLPARVPS